MSDEATRAYGNASLQWGISGRPLVTFALFSYNQEDFIREAIESAFSQTYSPLEIILSDDCSSDQTFEIMEEMASAYIGPHRVVARRNEANLGTLKHVLTVARMAQGDYLVVAAGDDISFPERTGVQVEELIRADETVAVLSSADIIFDGNGDLSCQKWNFDMLRGYHVRNKSWFHGATACYRTDILRKFKFPDRKVYYEDMAFMAIFENMGLPAIYMERPVIRRRYHQNNVGMERPMADPWSEELRVIRRIGCSADALNYAADVLEASKMNAKNLRSQAGLLRGYENWPNIGVLGRFKLFIECLRIGRMRRSVLRVLLGRRFFIWFRSVL